MVFRCFNGKKFKKMEVFAQEILPILEQSEVDLNKFVIPEKLADLDGNCLFGPNGCSLSNNVKN